MKIIGAILILIIHQSVTAEVLVSTKLGDIRGTTRISRDGKKFNTFLGVPYAEPPIGDLRLENPKPANPWNETLNATSYPPMCPQLSTKGFTGQEDCLYLNIYTPQAQKNQTKLPVWVFIFGGRRMLGHSSPYKYGPEYIMDKKVIFVTVNYRIGPMGFLSTEDSAIPGNYGLKDQQAALRWVQENIDAFGGDPTNVTLSGGSSGASDVSLHLISQSSKGFFHRCISQSGQLLNFWTLMKPGKGRQAAWNYAKVVDCPAKTSEQLSICLKSKPIEDLILATRKLMHDFFLPDTMFGPVIEHKHVEGAFLVDNPAELMKTPSNIPWILGVTADEGSLGSTIVFANSKGLNHFSRHYRKIFPQFFGYEHSSGVENITDILVSRYLEHRPLGESFYPFGELFGSTHAYVGAIETALQYRGPKYFYLYDYKNHPDYFRNYGGISIGKNTKGTYVKYEIGPIHGEELISMFNYPYLLPPTIRGNDRIVSDQVLSLWYNFVTTGDPNDENEQIWKPVTTSNLEYLHINNLTLTMKDKLMWDEYQFWKKLDTSILITSETHRPIWKES
ncbi:juvenile hormone esterase-like isoform X2 [Planococcus citri]